MKQHLGGVWLSPDPLRGIHLPHVLVPTRSPLGASTCGGDGDGGGGWGVAPVRPPPCRQGVAAAGRVGASPRLREAAAGLTCAGRRHSPHLRSATAAVTAAVTAAMQETNTFLLSALQPEAGVCSLALPSDRQLDGRSREAAEAQRLRSARVQEQVRIRMMLRGQAAPRPEAPDHADGGRGGRTPAHTHTTPPPATGAGVKTGGGSPWGGSGLGLTPRLGAGVCPPPHPPNPS